MRLMVVGMVGADWKVSSYYWPRISFIWNQFTHPCSTALIFLWRCTAGLEMNEKIMNLWSEWVRLIVVDKVPEGFLSFCLFVFLYFCLFVFLWLRVSENEWKENELMVRMRWSWWGASRLAGLSVQCVQYRTGPYVQRALFLAIPQCQIHKHKYKYTITAA